MELTESQLEMINYSMKVLILATTAFFVMTFIVIFFGLIGPPQTSQDTLITLSPVILLLIVLSVIFNLTRYRCPHCRTFISRKQPCPVCAAIQKGKTADFELTTREQPEIDSFLQEEVTKDETAREESNETSPGGELADNNENDSANADSI
ncbi:MAG: hypothetical protein ACXAEU_23665 [Candidatus Hodarchaeales archaeon]|jgi:hypothetical protein